MSTSACTYTADYRLWHSGWASTVSLVQVCSKPGYAALFRWRRVSSEYLGQVSQSPGWLGSSSAFVLLVLVRGKLGRRRVQGYHGSLAFKHQPILEKGAQA